MSVQMKADAWSLGYDWAMGDVYIGENCTNANYLMFKIMPEFEEGVEAAIQELKDQELIKLLKGEIE